MVAPLEVRLRLKPKQMKPNLCRIALALAVAATTTTANAQIRITEVNPTGSATDYNADWFEIMNTGMSSIDLTGWRMDDSSASFASAVTLRGVTSISPGQLIVVLESNTSGTDDAEVADEFRAAWFGNQVPAGLTLGFYGGSGVGLGAGGDAINLFDASGTLMAGVTFGAAPAGASFDNAAGLNNTVISQASVSGVNGAFVSLTSSEIGSPGLVPEPSVFALLGVAAGALLARRRASSSIELVR